MSLPKRIRLIETDRDVLNDIAKQYHYKHAAVHQRSTPFGYMVEFDGNLYMPDGSPCGIIIFASIHFTKWRGVFGYPGLPTKWQVLSLSRLWLHDDLPRNSETVVIAKAIKPQGHEQISRVGRDWLRVHPPRYPEEPYHIRVIVSYSDKTHGHEGTIYKASNFTYKGDTTSQKRHKNTRGSGEDGHTLAAYIYHLPEPKISIFDFPNQQLPLLMGQPNTGMEPTAQALPVIWA